MRLLTCGLVLAACLASSGCWFKKKAPAGPIVIRSAVPPPSALPPAPENIPEPVIDVPNDPGANSIPAPSVITQLPKPVPPPKPGRSPAETRLNRPQPQTPVAVPPASAPQPLPTLGALLSPQERERLTSEYALRKKRAESVLSLAANRRLSSQQDEAAQRIRSFLRQADEKVGQDIATAVQLIRRADLLATDLSASLR